MIEGQNLKLNKRVKINGGHYFVMCNGFAYIGTSNQIDVVDVRIPDDAKLVYTLKLKNAVLYLAVYNGFLYASERHRALHIIDLAKPECPVIKDAVPLYGNVCSGFTVLNDFAVMAFQPKPHIGLIDLKNTFQMQPVHTLKFSNCYNGIVQCNGRLFFSDGEHTLVELGLNNGRLEIIKQYDINNFKSWKIFISRNRLYLYGSYNSLVSNFKFLVLDSENPETVISESKSIVESNCILPFEKKDAIFLNHSTWSYFNDDTGDITPLFNLYQNNKSGEYIEVPVINEKEVYTEEIEHRAGIESSSHADRIGSNLFTVNSTEFLIWEIQKGSVFEKIQGNVN